MWPEPGKTLDYRLRLYKDKSNTKKLLCTDPETKKYFTTIGPTKSEKYLLFAEKSPWNTSVLCFEQTENTRSGDSETSILAVWMAVWANVFLDISTDN